MALHFVYKNLLTNGSMGSSINSFGIDLNQAYLTCIQAVWTGSPVGSIQLEISCDNVQPINANNADPAGNVVNWSVYTGSPVAVSGAGSNAWIITGVGYRWIRVQYVYSSGTGSLLVQANTKGP